MIKSLKPILLVALFSIVISCNDNSKSIDKLKSSIENQISKIDGDVAVAFLDLSDANNQVFINVDEKFHAASTMKVPVMIELYKQQAEGKLNLNDSILLKNQFKSIVDGSLYSMDIGEDSDDVIYSKIGMQQKMYDLMYSMIILSSNLATNVLIEVVDAKKTTATMRTLGADKIQVLRGVEDMKAYEQGLSNSTTANDLLMIMKAIATGKAGTKEATEKMIAILKDQKWNDMIPKYLPKGVEVAHKTGSITGVHHDAAIVFHPNGKKYVLVLLSKNLKDFDKGTDQLAQISKSIYDFMN
ncbi:MAG: class A beta-lactamase-related serine hydrolase [Polaribacter sp.]|jgi:beta-lactamase class A|nr:class A beta-lactamase-related serine hydrolase [Polaribacter sp.]MDG1812285.1 class A beta-lactamase-related serine hydrolase [Polaribacter sp.]MDG1993607.1 class A beta-lactamase-related serine hydrolase [Polaribacter sp.]